MTNTLCENSSKNITQNSLKYIASFMWTKFVYKILSSRIGYLKCISINISYFNVILSSILLFWCFGYYFELFLRLYTIRLLKNKLHIFREKNSSIAHCIRKSKKSSCNVDIKTHLSAYEQNFYAFNKKSVYSTCKIISV